MSTIHCGIHMGNIVDRDAAMGVADAICKILACPVDQETLRVALGAFHKTAEIKQNSISNCNFKVPVEDLLDE